MDLLLSLLLARGRRRRAGGDLDDKNKTRMCVGERDGPSRRLVIDSDVSRTGLGCVWVSETGKGRREGQRKMR